MNLWNNCPDKLMSNLWVSNLAPYLIMANGKLLLHDGTEAKGLLISDDAGFNWYMVIIFLI